MDSHTYLVKFTVFRKGKKSGLHLKRKIRRPFVRNVFAAGKIVAYEARQEYPESRVVIRYIEWTDGLELDYEI